MNCKNIPHGATRRTILRVAAGFAGAGAFGFPAVARAQARTVKLIHAAPAALPLWSVTFLAEDLGFYKDEGLNVERIKLNNGPSAMTALLSGEGTASMATPGEMLAANARGQKVKAIVSYTKTDAYSILVSKQFAEKAKITAQSPLKDREAALKASRGAMRIGITAPGSATDLMARAAARQAGLDPAKDVTIVPLQSTPNGVAALANNAIDAVVTLSPFTEQTVAEFSAVPLMSVATGELREAYRLQGQCLQARPEDMASRPELYAALVRADVRALRVLMEKPDQARDILRKTRYTYIKEEVWPAVWKTQLRTFVSPFVTQDGMRAWIESGTIAGNPDPVTYPYSQVIEMKFVFDALKKIGWGFKS
jgi:ABC-type nitrate/sulfonate/bicarbonate transport system substrate-binding protein